MCILHTNYYRTDVRVLSSQIICVQIDISRLFYCVQSANNMSTKSSNLRQTELEPSFYFPQEFKDHLEDLVFEILKEKPSDPLEYAFNFFSKRLRSRKGMIIGVLKRM